MDFKQEFRKLKGYYQENDFEKIFNHELGMYFLKMRSISRSNTLKELAKRLKIDVSGVSGRKLFEFIFCKNIANEKLHDFINQIYEEERKTRIKEDEVEAAVEQGEQFSARCGLVVISEATGERAELPLAVSGTA